MQALLFGDSYVDNVRYFFGGSSFFSTFFPTVEFLFSLFWVTDLLLVAFAFGITALFDFLGGGICITFVSARATPAKDAIRNNEQSMAQNLFILHPPLMRVFIVRVILSNSKKAVRNFMNAFNSHHHSLRVPVRAMLMHLPSTRFSQVRHKRPF